MTWHLPKCHKVDRNPILKINILLPPYKKISHYYYHPQVAEGGWQVLTCIRDLLHRKLVFQFFAKSSFNFTTLALYTGKVKLLKRVKCAMHTACPLCSFLSLSLCFHSVFALPYSQGSMATPRQLFLPGELLH